MDHPPPPPRQCWLHPAVAPGRSPIAGTGLFASAPVPAGTPVSRLGGRLVSTAELLELFAEAATRPDPAYIDTISVTETLHLVMPPGAPNHYGNHSCDPNLWWAGHYTLTARRDIPAGAEVTLDYGTVSTAPGFRLVCACGSGPLCRGVITDEDWRRPELRRRYGGHWIPAHADRIARERRTSHGRPPPHG
ncbi:SET domain-containing protein [Streptomyces marincola]|uniref:SET domain-containing protein n=1 Tax=Streptomyces marincola TaxID=2878388 RepID=A0A1W7D4X6_9ACTN|nr:SET domain-containing protein-lysine N-methyltransferase [Streptomyces marincola]ARQ72064.1 hypothetical protein CAG99_27415 [Streptomyces marincola]